MGIFLLDIILILHHPGEDMQFTLESDKPTTSISTPLFVLDMQPELYVAGQAVVSYKQYSLHFQEIVVLIFISEAILASNIVPHMQLCGKVSSNWDDFLISMHRDIHL